MKPITHYTCSKCGKDYKDFYEACRCCNEEEFDSRQEIIKQAEGIMETLPVKINTPEDYVKVILGINKIISIKHSEYPWITGDCFEGLNELKWRCREYLNQYTESLKNRLNEQLDIEVEVEGKIYSPFNVDNILNYMFDKDYTYEYNFVKRKNNS